MSPIGNDCDAWLRMLICTPCQTQKLQRLEAQVNESAGRYKEAKDDRSRMREVLHIVLYLRTS